MSRGVSLGGAYFELTASSAPLIAALQQAESASARSVAAIAQQLGKSEKDVQRLAQSWIAAEKQRADASAQSALKIMKAHNDEADAAEKAAGKLGLSLDDVVKRFTGVGIAAGGAVAAFELAEKAAEKLAEAMHATVEATLKADQATRQLTATYGGAATQMKTFADAQAAAFNRTNTEVEQGVARMAVLQKQYGITSDEIEKLTRVALNLGATFGDQAEAIRSVQSAIRGEPEALEKYGIALQQNAIQNNDLLTESEKKNFASLDAVTQARLRYQIILQQSAQFEGAAAERAASMQGGFDKLARATNEIEVALGKVFVPTLSKTAGLLGELTDQVAATVDAMSKLPSAQSPAEKTLDAVGLAALRAAGPVGQIVAGLIQINRDFGPTSAPTSDTGTQYGPSPGDIQAITDRLKAAEKLRQDQIAAIRKEARADEAKAGEEAAQQEHDLAIKGLDAQKVVLEVEKDAKLKAVEAGKDAALKGIEAESQAAKEASDARIAHLHVEEQAAKQSATDKHDAAVAGIEAESKAVSDAVDENIRNLEIERDASKQASEDKRDAALRALDDEKQARDKARTEEDRASEDALTAAKRQEDDRHQGALRGLDDEVKAANDRKDAALRAIQTEADAAEKGHQARLRHLSDEADAAHKKHDRAVSELDAEDRRASDQHDAIMQRLSDEADADRAAAEALQRIRDDGHKQALRDLDAEAEAARAAADQASRALDARYQTESRQRDATHEAAARGFDAEAEAAKAAAEQISRARAAAHEQVLRQIDQESDAAHDAHDRALAEIDRQKTAEDDRHRAAMQAIDAEQQNRQDAVDAQLAALDRLDQADQQASQDKTLQGNVTNARFGVLKAQSSGNQSEIVKAQQELDAALAAIDRTRNQRERDVQRDALKARKDAIKDEEDARRDAEDALNQQRQREVAAAKDVADASLKAALDALDSRKQAEGDTYAAAVQASKDALDKQLGDIDRRKRAEADAYAAAKQQASDVYDAAKQAAADALKVQLDAIAKWKQDETDAYDAVKREASDALQAQLDAIGHRKRAEDDAYKAGQDRRAAEKRELDDALAKHLDRVDKAKQAEDDAYAAAKDRLDKRKVLVGDTNKDELEKIAARKTAENDAHDNAVLKAQDQATQEKRAVQDRRTAEDLADKDKRQEIQDAFANEARDRKARYDDEATGEIPALHRALDAAREHFKERKTAADVQYQSETHQIDDTYNNAEHGLIPLAQNAAIEVAKGFQAQTKAVNEEAGKQKTAINDEYSNPGKTGLLDLLERARADTEQKLQDQQRYWDTWKEDLGGPQGKITRIIDKTKDLIEQITKLHPVSEGGRRSGSGDNLDDPSSHGGGPGGAGSSAGVPSPYRVTFPFDAPYNGPYAGGAAWPGGPSRHRGVDLALPGSDNGRGTPYGAFQAGTVAALIPESQDPAGGNGIIIRTDSGLYNYYGHNDRFLIGQGDRVEQGQQIGVLGRSGLDEGMQTHLHYEVRRGINGDPAGQTINPVPYMSAGGAGQAGGRVFEFDLFGRHFRFVLPFGSPTGDVGEWIAAALQADGLPADWLVPMEQIAAAESGTRNADGSVNIGTGSATAVNPGPPDENGEVAKGLMQMKPSTFEGSRLHSLPDDIFNPVANAAAAAQYIRFHPNYGDPRRTPYFDTGRFDWRGVPGYADGGLIPEPTLLVGRTRGPYAMAGETGRPEWVTPNAPGVGAAEPVEHLPVNVMLGNDVVQRVWITGYQLHARRGSLPSSFGALA